MVEAILRAIWPDLPMPLTTTRPLQLSNSATASRKVEPKRAARLWIASASMASTCLARSSTVLDGAILSMRDAAGIIGQSIAEPRSLPSELRATDDRFPRTGAGAAGERRAGGGARAQPAPAADAGIPAGRRGDRAALPALDPGERGIDLCLSGRIRRGVPDVLHRTGIQPAQAVQHAPRGVWPRDGAGAAHFVCADRGRLVARLSVAAWLRPRRSARHVLDRDREQAPGRAHAARIRARARDHRRSAVSGLGRGAALDPDPGAGATGGAPCAGAGAGAGQSRGGAGADPVCRPEADARLVPYRGAA